MLVLVLLAGATRVALRAEAVVEVIPRIPLGPLPGWSALAVGLLNYHGRPVPVVSLPAALSQDAKAETLANRIVIMRRSNAATGSAEMIGLLVDGISDVKRVSDVVGPSSDLTMPGSFLRGLLPDDAGGETGFLPLVAVEELFARAAGDAALAAIPT